MLKLQLLPAICGDCIWLEYGIPPRVVIIDGGLRETAKTLGSRIVAACRERGTDTLEVELLVVTHIDNDHILGIIELLKSPPAAMRVKDVWFNGRPQLLRLPAPATRGRMAEQRDSGRGHPADLMGSADDASGWKDRVGESALPSPSDLLGPQQGDELSGILAAARLPWNRHPRWNGDAIIVPDAGNLPAVTLDGGLRLTLLGPTLARLYKLCTAWSDVLGGTDEPTSPAEPGPADLLGRRNTWPPVWKDEERRDPSAANGSSIMLLAEFGDHALLLAGDGHAPDLAAALKRLSGERNQASAPPALPLAAFKLPHHASEKNLTRAVLETVDCNRYLISTDGSGHGHPDHQALLRILRYSRRSPQLFFNYATNTTLPWGDSKSDILEMGFQDYETQFPTNPADGLILNLD
jgi:beta-lactamase superfamily II metal-dependent hydrolase